MRTPYTVIPNLTDEQCHRWYIQFQRDGRDIAEGMWRRSHDAYTQKTYGTPADDHRRRLVHFMDKYEIVQNEQKPRQKDLVISESYLYICSTMPAKDVGEYWQKHLQLAEKHGWKLARASSKSCLLTNEDYQLNGKIYKIHPCDLIDVEKFPSDYRTVEFILRTKGESVSSGTRETPWDVWRSKYRRPIPREEPKVITDLSQLAPYFPMHIELGCGPSLEAGIPPLSQLHHIYSAADYSTGKFLFGHDDTLLERIVTDISSFYKSAAEPYKACFSASLTNFYSLLGTMKQHGLLIEPLINNNFDGLAKLAGFKELYIRRYKTSTWIPDIPFNRFAKSLLVVGSHADRRLVRVQARAAGLQVIYVDPEGYYDSKGHFKSYPLEALSGKDILIKMTAAEFAAKLASQLTLSDSHSLA